MTPWARIRVLIADDNADIRDALASLIERNDHLELAATAADAREAVEFAALEQPDVALVDVRMPAGGGIAAARGIAACSPQTRMIALSAAGVVPESLELIVTDCITKGSPIKEIVGAILRSAGRESDSGGWSRPG